MEWNDRVRPSSITPSCSTSWPSCATSTPLPNEFRDVVRELSLFETYEATRDLPLTNVFIQTPIAPFRCQADHGPQGGLRAHFARGPRHGGRSAGGHPPGPRGTSGHAAQRGDPRARELLRQAAPRHREPPRLRARSPCSPPGGSAEAAVKYLREAGVAGTIRFLCLVSAPEGIERLLAADDDLIIYTCAYRRRPQRERLHRPRPRRRRRPHLRNGVI